MEVTKDVVLPSGASIKIQAAPFAIAKNLYQALLRELKHVAIPKDREIPDLYKELFCLGFSSPEIEAWVWECFQHCSYNGTGEFLKITKNTFEPIAAREDYMSACMEVGKENVFPFGKSLYAEYKRASAMMENVQK